jgi:hypothetical protein
VALYYSSGDFDLSHVHAVGGNGRQRGGAGTILLKSTAQTIGDLVVDADDAAPGRATPIFSIAGAASSGLTANTLTDASAAFTPGSLIGLRLNPDTTQAQTFRVVANDATTISTDPDDGALTSVAASGDAYGGVYVIEHLELRERAVVELVNADTALADRSGLLVAADVTIGGTSRLTHPAATPTAIFGLQLVLDGMLSVDASSRIDAAGLGFLGGLTTGNPTSAGRTLGNTTVGGSTERNGGSHGGLGGLGNSGGSVAATYDDAMDPDDPGSGGAANCGANPANAGGGVIRIDVPSFVLDGQVTADGGSDLSNGCYGGGAGGAIRIDVGTLAGAGTIHADGGSAAAASAGGGGGGRVAVFYDDADDFELGNVTAAGGAGFNAGGAGSVVVDGP